MCTMTVMVSPRAQDAGLLADRPQPVAPPEGFVEAVTAFQDALRTGGMRAVESLLEERSLAQSTATREATRK